MIDFIDIVFRGSQKLRLYPFCHSRPDRSFRYKGRYFGLCARCTTMYATGLLTLLISPIWSDLVPPHTALILGTLFLVPGGVDGTTQMVGSRESTNKLRATTGALLGIGVVLFLHGFVYSIANIGL